MVEIGTISPFSLVGLIVNASSEHITSDLSAICGVGFTTTVKSTGLPSQSGVTITTV